MMDASSLFLLITWVEVMRPTTLSAVTMFMMLRFSTVVETWVV